MGLTTMTSTGFGDFRPRDNSDRVTMIIMMVIGTVLFGYVFALMTATVTNTVGQE